ncbi:MAG: thioredoxin family protein [Armatimonadetes bacterium]|nr:thioredoxin family protein [Armatimonadota bacterium]
MQRTQAIGLILVALALGFVVGFKSGKGAAAAAAPAVVAAPEAPPVATAPTATPGTPRPRLVELGSTTCIPCKEMAPILEELKQEYAGKVDVEFIDVNVDVAAADRYGINVIPTQVFIDRDGKEVFRHEGFYPKADILAQFEKMGIPIN